MKARAAPTPTCGTKYLQFDWRLHHAARQSPSSLTPQQCALTNLEWLGDRLASKGSTQRCSSRGVLHVSRRFGGLEIAGNPSERFHRAEHSSVRYRIAAGGLCHPGPVGLDRDCEGMRIGRTATPWRRSFAGKEPTLTSTVVEAWRKISTADRKSCNDRSQSSRIMSDA